MWLLKAITSLLLRLSLEKFLNRWISQNVSMNENFLISSALTKTWRQFWHAMKQSWQCSEDKTRTYRIDSQMPTRDSKLDGKEEWDISTFHTLSSQHSNLKKKLRTLIQNSTKLTSRDRKQEILAYLTKWIAMSSSTDVKMESSQQLLTKQFKITTCSLLLHCPSQLSQLSLLSFTLSLAISLHPCLDIRQRRGCLSQRRLTWLLHEVNVENVCWYLRQNFFRLNRQSQAKSSNRISRYVHQHLLGLIDSYHWSLVFVHLLLHLASLIL